MSKYVCTECGSDDIEVRMWVGANDNHIDEWVDDENCLECWCRKCLKITTWRQELSRIEKAIAIVHRIDIQELIEFNRTTVFCTIPADYDVTLEYKEFDDNVVDITLFFNGERMFKNFEEIKTEKKETLKKMIETMFTILRADFVDELYNKMFNQ